MAVAHQAPLSMELCRQEYRVGCHALPARGLPDEGTEPKSLTSLALAGALFTTNTTWEALRELFARLLPGLGQFSHRV